MQALAELASPPVSAQAISKYEAGKMMPSSAVLVGLGKALKVSLDFLMSSQVQAVGEVEFRGNEGTSAQDRAQAEAIVTEKLEDYLAVEDILQLAPANDPFASFAANPIEQMEAIDGIALALREKWSLGIDPIPSMTALLEEKGIVIIESALPARLNVLACSVQCSGDRPNIQVLLVSTQASTERKRFSLAEELARRVLLATKGANIKLEKAIERFAAAFLAPAEHLIEEAGASRQGVTPNEVIRLKRLYGISAAAMLMRLGQVGILPQSAISYAFRTNARSWRVQEPAPYHYKEGFGAFEQPQRYEGLVWRALGERLISPMRAAQLLHTSLAEVEQGLHGALSQ